jgi:hypothetical protein
MYTGGTRITQRSGALSPFHLPCFPAPRKKVWILSPSRRREAPCEGTNSPRLFTPGETKALAKYKVHQWARAWVTVSGSVVRWFGGSVVRWFGGWSSSLISKIWRTVMNGGHWLVQFKVCIITTVDCMTTAK